MLLGPHIWVVALDCIFHCIGGTHRSNGIVFVVVAFFFFVVQGAHDWPEALQLDDGGAGTAKLYWLDDGSLVHLVTH